MIYAIAQEKFCIDQTENTSQLVSLMNERNG